MHVVLVVPCYNEAHRLPVDAFRGFRSDGARIEFLFVNDGSTDTTRGLLDSFAATDSNRVSVLHLDRNQGKAEAVRRGIVAALERHPDFVGFWDADLATPLSELPSFLEIFAAQPGIDIVIGARVRLLGREISRRPARHYFGRVGATLISSSLRLAVYDTQCGAKVFRANDTIREIFSRPFLSRWIFDVEILARYVQRHGRERAVHAIYELPIKIWRDVKGSKVGTTDFARALADLWKIHRAYHR